MEKINCPICDSSQSYNFIKLKDRFKTKNTTFKLVKCTCGLVYLNPRPNELDICNYYKNINYTPHNKVSIFYKLAQSFSYNWKYKLVKSNCSTGAQLLDYGSGKGEFSNYLQNKGLNVDNYEPILETNDEKIINKSYDIITLWHSLEHIHDLSKAINKIKMILKANGLIIIAVPNLDAAEEPFFKNEWAAYDAPRHLYHFNEDSINNLLSKHGLKIIKSQNILQDTFYNIYLSIKTNNIILKAVKLFFISILCYLKILFNSKYSSSKLYLCTKK